MAHKRVKLPEEMKEELARLKRCKSKQECLTKTFSILTERYYGRSLYTYTLLHKAFHKDLHRLWSRHGFLHCHHFNRLLKLLLLGSGKFSPRDIREKWTAIIISPHQYLQVNVGTEQEPEWLDVDPWAYEGWRTPFGQHAGW